MIKKFIFLLAFLITASSHSFADDDENNDRFLTLELNISSGSTEDDPSCTPTLITIDPSNRNVRKSLDLANGSEVIVQFDDPTHQFYNDDLNSSNIGY
jgi:hypothetical protein